MKIMIVNGAAGHAFGRRTLSTLTFPPRAFRALEGQTSRDRGLCALSLAEVLPVPTPDPTLDVTPARLR